MERNTQESTQQDPWNLLHLHCITLFNYSFTQADTGCKIHANREKCVLTITGHPQQCKVYEYTTLTHYNLKSVYIFSMLFFIHFLRCWQGEFNDQSKASFVGDHFLYSHDLNVWFRGILWREIWCLSLSEFKGLKFVTKMFFYYPSWLKSMHLGFDAAQVYNWIIFLTYILVIQLCSHMYMVWWYSNCLQFFKWMLWYNFVSLSADAFELTIEILFLLPD